MEKKQRLLRKRVSAKSSGKLIQGVLALCKFHYCEFRYCGFSKLSRYVSKNLANAIVWAIYFFALYIHG